MHQCYPVTQRACVFQKQRQRRCTLDHLIEPMPEAVYWTEIALLHTSWLTCIKRHKTWVWATSLENNIDATTVLLLTRTHFICIFLTTNLRPQTIWLWWIDRWSTFSVLSKPAIECIIPNAFCIQTESRASCNPFILNVLQPFLRSHG